MENDSCEKSLLDTVTHEQKAAIEAVLRGDSVFITGPGGTGKSYLLEALRQEFKKLGRVLAVTAMTGCAALLLGSHAKTLHSWAGIGLGKGTVEFVLASIAKNGRHKKNWRKTDCLVIDEVSMLTPQLLGFIDQVGQGVRRSKEPFGGLQVVFVGDFYQLPPVAKEEGLAFQSDLWRSVVKGVYQLTKIHRQKDEVFQTILNEARCGELSDESYAVLEARKAAVWKGQPIRPTMLFTLNADIDTINAHYYGKLKGDEYVYKMEETEFVARSEGESEDDGIAAIFKKCKKAKAKEKAKPMVVEKHSLYEQEIRLKVGAQVMLLYSLSPKFGLVNGSRGVVREFTSDGLPRVQFASFEYLKTIDRHKWRNEDSPMVKSQIPLRLAYALTIHKAQGASLDSALVDIGTSTFEYGQAYVALSRVRSLEALYVHELDRRAFKVHPAVKEFYRSLRSDEEKINSAQTNGSDNA